MKKIIIFFLVLSLALLAGACVQKGPAAKVNGVEITREALEHEMRYDLEAYKAEGITLSKEDEEAIKQSALERLIGTFLLKEAAAKAGLSAESIDVEGELAAVRGEYADEAAFIRALADADFTLDTYRTALTDILIIEALFEQELELSKVTVSEEEVQERVDLYLENYEGEDELDLEELEEYARYMLSEDKAQALRNQYLDRLWQESEIEFY